MLLLIASMLCHWERPNILYKKIILFFTFSRHRMVFCTVLVRAYICWLIFYPFPFFFGTRTKATQLFRLVGLPWDPTHIAKMGFHALGGPSEWYGCQAHASGSGALQTLPFSTILILNLDFKERLLVWFQFPLHIMAIDLNDSSRVGAHPNFLCLYFEFGKLAISHWSLCCDPVRSSVNSF